MIKWQYSAFKRVLFHGNESLMNENEEKPEKKPKAPKIGIN